MLSLVRVAGGFGRHTYKKVSRGGRKNPPRACPGAGFCGQAPKLFRVPAPLSSDADESRYYVL
ncbi:MAG: hypothetical protein LBG26_04670, partial [Treponema sp.]|nr:hypothetical protein [Treponema sp.]